MKKYFAILLSAMLMLSLAVPAMAADETYTITINNSVKGYTYVAYQIFAGDLKAVEGSATDILSNIVWGTGVDETGKEAMGDAAAKAASLTEANVKEFALAIAAYVQNPSVEATYDETGKVYKISDLEPGYYLIKNTKVPGEADEEFYSDYILEVVEDTTVSPKGSIPTSEKKVKDTNDSDETVNADSNWQDSADYDIGDDVPFKLSATLPSNLADYEEYVLVFHDKLSDGLSFNNDVVVKVDGKEITSGYTIVTDSAKMEAENPCSFEIHFTDVTAAPVNATANGIITVEYTAKLTEDAVIGSAGNDNTMHIEFSNDPNNNGESGPTGTTPEDRVVVFTYDVIVNKVDENQEALVGAGFTLYKWVETAEAKGWVAIGEEKTGETKTRFVWSGLDDGKYKLEETTTPDGYNTIAPIEFTISAEHDIDKANPVLTKLETTFTNAETKLDNGTITGTVMNRSGSTLPETGGMGTTIFYIVGGIMAVSAVVLLVTKKRMSAEG